ncbi:hypothetical protein SAY86_019542 [Trapa natans]|uniref:AB hydrolase-1 domain-containing protein n=1 Tax=Trapa natans TaxID=22666 RepID=A0AAN7R6X3_TRANT|nr:hypothetical protein SAY86_019542 [Trapa natans]
MAVIGKVRFFLVLSGTLVNDVVSFVVFCLLDLLDAVLCYVYKVADFVIEAEWRPCYCSSARGAIASSGGKILVSERGESKLVNLSSSKVMLEEVSDTLYARTSLVSELSLCTVKRLKPADRPPAAAVSSYRGGGKTTGRSLRSSAFTVNSTIIELLQGKASVSRPIPRWSDCVCSRCTSWTSRGRQQTLFVREAGAKDGAQEDVLFIHGFISSSQFWTETLFPHFSESAKATYRLLAMDLLGFGRSPKPSDSLYTLREHLEKIERSVLEPYRVKSFHIVAHSLGCILALALAVKHPGSVKSLTLLAPPYYQVPKGVQATQYVMRKVAARKVWPPMAFGASLTCWYEHITRTACLVVSKNHRLWESITKIVTMNRIRTYMFDGFFCHTHHAAWHTLHNVICGTAGKLDGYLDAVNDRLSCGVTIFHGMDDELIPLECSHDIQKRIQRAVVKEIENKDHLTIVIGRQEAFARELEEIWRKCGN